MKIGIDFGTCFSSIAFMSGLIPVTNIIEDDDRTGIPTVFMYSRNSQKELYGYECNIVEAAINPSDVIRYMKRTIRQNPNNMNMTVQSGGKTFTMGEIVKKFLMYLLAQAKNAAIKSGEFENSKYEAITIAAPVGIAGGQMTATDYNKLLASTIIELTGLNAKQVNVIQEPVAAAISFLYSENMKKRYDKNQTILVFDLGGGTLDVTIVEHNPFTNEYNINAKEGDLKLGGNDWDQILSEAILNKSGITDDFASVDEKEKFLRNVIRLKHELSNFDDSEIVFKHNGAPQFVEFSREEFERASKALLDRAMTTMKKAIDDNSPRGISAIDKIVLVGGSCNMPQIRNRILVEFPSLDEDDVVTHDPSKAIAKGAAIYAQMESKKVDSHEKVEQITVNDIATHTYGFSSRRSSDKKDMIYNLLFKGTPFDENGKIVVKSSTDFIAIKDTQTEICWTVYESNCKQEECDEGNWMEYGTNENANGMKVTVQIPSEYIGKARSYSLWVAFSLDTNGILEIIITDKDGKQVGYDKKQI